MHTETNIELIHARQIAENTDTNLFLTGKAGTGKTTFLKTLKKKSHKRIVVVAPTGIAAINAGGVTIHSFFQLPFAPFVPDAVLRTAKQIYRFGKEKKRILRCMDLLVIDEISMVRADLLDAIDYVMRLHRERNRPFGGVQLLLIGDLQQLAPVVRDEEWAILSKFYETPYFFSSKALQETDYAVIELKQVYRQSDTLFLSLLNSIRANKATAATLATLNKRYMPGYTPRREEHYIRLTTHNAQAQQVNEAELAKLPSRAYSFRAEISGNFPEYSYPTDHLLTLKKGAQVMFIKNDHTPAKRYYNGMLGEVSAIDDTGLTVKSGSTEIKVERENWTNTRYTLNEETKEITEEVEGTFTQFPVKTAWAITIHKSQGLTFEHAIIDTEKSFAHGQAYVALSRCKSLEGLILETPLTPTAIITDSAVSKYSETQMRQTINDEDIQRMQRRYFGTLCEDLFGFKALWLRYGTLLRIIEEHFYKVMPALLSRYRNFESTFNEKILAVADRFHIQYTKIIESVADYNEDPVLRERLKKGAAYFAGELTPLHTLVSETNLPTDNRELKKKIEKHFGEFIEILEYRIALLMYVAENGMRVNDFLRKKAMIMPEEGNSATKKHKEKKAHKEESIKVTKDIQNPRLYKKLIAWRTEKMREQGLPAYCIMHQRAIIGIANNEPRDKHTLLRIPSIGKKSVEKYGDEILAIVRAAAEE